MRVVLLSILLTFGTYAAWPVAMLRPTAEVATVTKDLPTVTASALGCVPNDPKFDNGPLIQAALDLGQNVELDDGPVYYTSPLRTNPGMACTISGQSSAMRHWAKGSTGFRPFDPAQEYVLLVQGSDEKSVGHNQTVRDLFFYCTEKCDAVRVTGGRTVAIQNCYVTDARRGIWIKPEQSLYAPSIQNCSVFKCDVGIQVENGVSVCSLSIVGTQVIGGRVGVDVRGWKRGATFVGCVVEGQSEWCVKLEDARATLIGSYLENGKEALGRLRMKDSGLVGIDTTCGNVSHNATSTLDWIGGNSRPYSLPYP